jgi:dipeptidyl aminopeptidase/acylaminoacyl peptidase
MIESLRRGSYRGSELVIEETLAPGANYDRHIASYSSEGLEIRALLTVPQGEAPRTGWPVIIFNHGYIPPTQYRTTERYVAYVDGFARSGYIVLRPDYRGHDRSEGEATGAYQSPGYTIDVLNAVATMQAYPDADPDRIGMWGHSMGGHITLQVMVSSDDVKAGVIWAGLMGSYQDLLERWWWPRWDRAEGAEGATLAPDDPRVRWAYELEQTYGTFEENPQFWRAISPSAHLGDVSGPIQLHHGTADTSVTFEFSQNLYTLLEVLDEPAELYLYEGDNHNLSNSFTTAMARSIEFFDRHVKGWEPPCFDPGSPQIQDHG